MSRDEIVKDIINKIQDKWGKLAEDFYMCYSVDELAQKINIDLQCEYFKDLNVAPSLDFQVYCKKYKDKFKFAIPFAEDIYFIFDIWWATGVFGDCGLHCGNGKIYEKLPKGYKEKILECN